MVVEEKAVKGPNSLLLHQLLLPNQSHLTTFNGLLCSFQEQECNVSSSRLINKSVVTASNGSSFQNDRIPGQNPSLVLTSVVIIGIKYYCGVNAPWKPKTLLFLAYLVYNEVFMNTKNQFLMWSEITRKWNLNCL